MSTIQDLFQEGRLNASGTGNLLCKAANDTPFNGAGEQESLAEGGIND